MNSGPSMYIFYGYDLHIRLRILCSSTQAGRAANQAIPYSDAIDVRTVMAPC